MKIVSFFALLISLQSCHAQVKGTAKSFVDTEIMCWDFRSAVIGDDYRIYVHVPPGYDTAKTAYPAFYLTDGDWDKNMAIDAFNMLRQDYITREAVIVGIGYGNRPNQRDRDLEPAKGGPGFLLFIEKELVPFIKSKYRVTNDQTLSGYSYGGLFAAYALFNRPGLFSTVCIGAPAFSSNLLPMAQKYFAEHKELRARVFLSAGSYEHGTVNNMAQLQDYLLRQNATVELDTVPGANHAAAKPEVIQQGVAFAYCKKHKAITVPVTDLEKYVGIYALAGHEDKQVTFYVSNGRLYGAGGSAAPVQLVPFTKGGFFTYENEKAEMFFKEENGNVYELFMPYHAKPLRFDRIKK